MHARRAVDAVSSSKEKIRRDATFPEGVKNKDGRGCSEEVVAKGKVMPGKLGGADGDAHALPTNERAVRSPVSPPLPVKKAGTALPPMGASGE